TSAADSTDSACVHGRGGGRDVTISVFHESYAARACQGRARGASKGVCRIPGFCRPGSAVPHSGPERGKHLGAVPSARKAKSNCQRVATVVPEVVGATIPVHRSTSSGCAQHGRSCAGGRRCIGNLANGRRSPAVLVLQSWPRSLPVYLGTSH